MNTNRIVSTKMDIFSTRFLSYFIVPSRRHGSLPRNQLSCALPRVATTIMWPRPCIYDNLRKRIILKYYHFNVRKFVKLRPNSSNPNTAAICTKTFWCVSQCTLIVCSLPHLKSFSWHGSDSCRQHLIWIWQNKQILMRRGSLIERRSLRHKDN